MLLTVLLLCGGAFAYYFYFLESREADMDNRQYRALNRIESSLRISVEGCRNLFDAQTEAAATYMSEWMPMKLAGDTKKGKRFIALGNSDGNMAPLFDDDSEAPWKSVGDRAIHVDEIHIKKGGDDFLEEEKLSTLVAKGGNFTSLSRRFLHLDATAMSKFSKVEGVDIEDTNWTVQMRFHIAISEVIQPLLRYDMFDEFIIVHDDTIIHETFPTGQVKYRADTLLVDVHEGGSVLNEVRTLRINGRNFRAYEVGFSLEGSKGWTLIGLRSEETFSADKHNIPRVYLFSVFILVVFTVLALPFIKSLIMSRTERLTTTDAVFSAISLGLATSVLALLLFDGYLRFDNDNSTQEEQLHQLSRKVESNLSSEISAITNQLKEYIDYTKVGNYDSDFKSTYYPGFANLFFIDKGGETKLDCLQPKTKFDVGLRSYFKNIANHRYIYNGSDTVPFAMEGIVSWREQQLRCAIAIPARMNLTIGNQVYASEAVAITARLRSVSDPVLPLGVGFAIFDKNGMAVFHSDSSRSLNENILEECENEMKLRAAVYGRTTADLNVNYSGVPYAMYVQPMDNLPYYIATFQRRAPIDSAHGEVFGTGMVLQVLLFSVYLVLIFGGGVLSRQRSRLSIPHFSLSVFTPTRNGRSRYVKLLLFNVIHTLIIAVMIWVQSESLSVIVLFFLSAPLTVFGNTFLIAQTGFVYYFKSIRGRKLVFLYAIIFITSNAVAYQFVVNYFSIIVYQILIISTAVSLRLKSRPLHSTGLFGLIAKQFSYKRAYTVLVFTLAVVTCLMPVLVFATIAYNKEKEIEVKTAQLTMMQKIESRAKHWNSNDAHFSRLGLYEICFYESDTSLLPGNTIYETQEQSTYSFDAFSALLRAEIQPSSGITNRLKFGTADKLWYWRYTCDNRLVCNYLHSTSSFGVERQAQMSSVVPTFVFPSPFGEHKGKGARVVFLLVVFIVALYLILEYFVKKIFVNETFSRFRAQRFDQEFYDDERPDYKVFVTGMPNSGKSAYFARICSERPPCHILDFMEMNSGESWTAKVNEVLSVHDGVVILDHFEYDSLNGVSCLAKLDLFEKLILKKRKRIIVISTIHSRVFLNQLATSENTTVEDFDKVSERWSRVLSSFYSFYFPLNGFSSSGGRLWRDFTKTQKQEILSIPYELGQLVESECAHGTFLDTIGAELLNELHDRSDIDTNMSGAAIREQREELILRIQKVAENYYWSLWNHLTEEEQFVLYDLAQDGLVNNKNLDVVEVLVDKGIVVYSGKLRVMNRSFRNFILTDVSQTYLDKMDRSLKSSGNWSKLRMPLFFVVFTLLLFVLKSDGSPLFGYITGFTAIIPIAIAALGVFTQLKKKE